jgi:hypothetical protein
MSFRYKSNVVILPPIATQKITLKAKPIPPSLPKPKTINSFRSRNKRFVPEEKKQCTPRLTKPWRVASQELYELLVEKIRPFIQSNYLLVRNDLDQIEKKDEWIRQRSALAIAVQKLEAHQSKMFTLENAFLMRKEKCFVEIKKCLTQGECAISEAEKAACRQRIDLQREALSSCDNEFYQIEKEQVEQWENQQRIWLILVQQMKERLL